jgi:hypothetical protein
MKYKPPRRKRHIARPVGDLIPHSTHILITLLKKSDNVNGVCRSLVQTGFNYKRDVLDSLEYLEKANLITKQAIENSMKIKISLTDTGCTIARLIVNVEKYIKTRSRLDKTVREKFDLPYLKQGINRYVKETKVEPGQLVPILQKTGWAEEEINRFFHDDFMPPGAIQELLDDSAFDIINIVLHKYSTLLPLCPHENAKIIMQKIIIDLITELLEHVRGIYSFPLSFSGAGLSQANPFMRKYIEDDRNLNSDLMSSISSIYIVHTLGFGGFAYNFINDEVTTMLDSILSVAEPNLDLIRSKIDDFIKQEKKHMPSDNDQILRKKSILNAELYCTRLLKHRN